MFGLPNLLPSSTQHPSSSPLPQTSLSHDLPEKEQLADLLHRLRPAWWRYGVQRVLVKNFSGYRV
jgi:hypothetical protein